MPLATNRPASLPRSSAARSSRAITVGSSPKTSSPTSASAMARRIAAVGRVTVSLRRSIGRSGWSVMGGEYRSASCRVGEGGPTPDRGGRTCYSPASPQLDPWCSGPTCQPVTLEIAGSNPVGSAITRLFLRPVRPPGRGVLLARSMVIGWPGAPSGILWQTAPDETRPPVAGPRPAPARRRDPPVRPRRHGVQRQPVTPGRCARQSRRGRSRCDRPRRRREPHADRRCAIGGAVRSDQRRTSRRSPMPTSRSCR